VRTVDREVALVEAAEERGAEVHGPDAVADLLQADVLLGEYVADVDPLVGLSRTLRGSRRSDT